MLNLYIFPTRISLRVNYKTAESTNGRTRFLEPKFLLSCVLLETKLTPNAEILASTDPSSESINGSCDFLCTSHGDGYLV